MSTQLSEYSLYYLPHCPYCQRVLQAMQQLDIIMTMKDTGEPRAKQELLQGGGKTTVPCLRHPDGKWQYESLDIVAFLQKKFG